MIRYVRNWLSEIELHDLAGVKVGQPGLRGSEPDEIRSLADIKMGSDAFYLVPESIPDKEEGADEA